MSTLVVGAGMAGLAAAHELAAAGEAVTVIEAKERTGGRVFTDYHFADMPVEFGAEFIHGDRAASWRLVETLGLATLHWRKTDDSMVRLENGDWLSMREARERHPDFDLTRSWNLSAVDPLPAESWRGYLTRLGFNPDQLRYVKRSYANACGEAMRFLSAKAMLEQLAGTTDDGDGDYRIVAGYAKLTDYLSDGLDIRLGNPVTEIDGSGPKVEVKTLDGPSYEADALIVAVPLGVLQAEAIRFVPGLSEAKKLALAGLRMGPVIKMIYVFEQPVTPRDVMAVYSRRNPPMWWSPSFGRETDKQVWTGFASGEWAMDLLSLGEAGALQRGLESLGEELGNRRLTPSRMKLVNWPDDPYTRGGYSFVLPGHEGARERLAEPTPPLFWAGEACEPEARAATVHGAYLSGLHAADEVLRYRRSEVGAARSDRPSGNRLT